MKAKKKKKSGADWVEEERVLFPQDLLCPTHCWA